MSHADQNPVGQPAMLSPEELAAQTGQTVEQLRTLRRNGEGPAYIKISRTTVRYLTGDVTSWATDSPSSSS